MFLVWLGVGVDSAPCDELGAAAEVPRNYDPAVALSLAVKSVIVEPFKDGWAFCSYKIDDFSEAIPDSLRLLCYLGLGDNPIQADPSLS